MKLKLPPCADQSGSSWNTAPTLRFHFSYLVPGKRVIDLASWSSTGTLIVDAVSRAFLIVSIGRSVLDLFSGAERLMAMDSKA